MSTSACLQRGLSFSSSTIAPASAHFSVTSKKRSFAWLMLHVFHASAIERRRSSHERKSESIFRASYTCSEMSISGRRGMTRVSSILLVGTFTLKFSSGNLPRSSSQKAGCSAHAMPLESASPLPVSASSANGSAGKPQRRTASERSNELAFCQMICRWSW